MNDTKRIGFACAYTPLALIHAAGFAPYRILPDGSSEDQAGRLLHDNLCPHVKQILDRAMGGQIPALSGMVFMNSCDAMRRLYDGWKTVRPDVNAVLIDLPVTVNARSVNFFRNEIERLASILESWGGVSVSGDRLAQSLAMYNAITDDLEQIKTRVRNGDLAPGAAELQKAYNLASCTDPEHIRAELASILDSPQCPKPQDRVPVYVFGNMLPDPQAFSLFESCGADIIAEDMCTGSRLFTRMDEAPGHDPLFTLSNHILNKPACARTYVDADPGHLAKDVAERAGSLDVRGVIAYTAKFCDPYIGRLPHVREVLKAEGIPFLALEGDMTMRSLGQHRTRIEAFIEMLR